MVGICLVVSEFERRHRNIPQAGQAPKRTQKKNKFSVILCHSVANLMKSIIKIFLLSIFLVNPLFAQKETLEFPDKIGGYFNDTELNSLISIFKDLEKSELPTDLLMNRIKEGIARKAKPEIIIKVVRQKKENLIQSKKLLISYKKKVKIKNTDYSIKILAELLGKKIEEKELNNLINIGVANEMSFEEIIPFAEIISNLKERNIPPDCANEVVTTAIVKNIPLDITNKLSDLFFEIPQQQLSFNEQREIIIDGILNKRSIYKIKREIIDTAKQRSKEIDENRQIILDERR